MPNSLIVFNKSRSTAEDQFELLQKLPIAHEYGDASSVFIIEGKEERLGRAETNERVNPELRIRGRKRCTLALLTATHTGVGLARRPITEPIEVLTCFAAVPDWQAENLDAELFFLKAEDSDAPELSPTGPRIGRYIFDFAAFALSMYEDLAMCFDALKDTALESKTRCHLKIVPLGVGPTIKTRYGDCLGPYIIPVYLIVLQFACNAYINDSWVETLEFVDHSKGLMTPTLNLKKVRILSAVSRDAFDFTASTGLPTILLPCDAFCVLGSGARNLATTLSNNSNMKSIDFAQSIFRPWPFV